MENKIPKDLEYIYKITVSGSGARIFKFKVGSITKQNIIYQNGTSKVRVKISNLNHGSLTDVSHERSHNAAVIYSIDNLENNHELKISLSRLAVSLYRNYINEYIKTYDEIEERLNNLDTKLLLSKEDIVISNLDIDS